MVAWSVVASATGYRVARATAADGPYATAADFDVATATSTKASGITNVYFVDAQRQSIGYIEVLSDTVTTGPRRYYRITAYNAAGDAAPSAVVCGTPPPIATC